MDLNVEVWVWAIIFIAVVIVEIATQGLTSIWFAPGALIALIIAVLHGHLALQISIFMVLSLVLLFFTRPIAVKYINDRKIKTNVEALVGTEGVVSETINNVYAQGAAMVNGLEWTARSANPNAIIEKDTRIVVNDVQGVKIIVSPKFQ